MNAYDESTGVLLLNGDFLTLFNIEESEQDDICVYDFTISVSKVEKKGLGLFSQTASETVLRQFNG